MSTVDCFALAAYIKGGSSVCIVECGGVYLKSGDLLLVKHPLAQHIWDRYSPYFSKPISVQLQDATKLRNGHYEVRRLKLFLGEKPTETTAHVEPVNISEKHVEEPKEIEHVAVNRSMASPDGQKRTRRKAKRKEENNDA